MAATKKRKKAIDYKAILAALGPTEEAVAKQKADAERLAAENPDAAVKLRQVAPDATNEEIGRVLGKIGEAAWVAGYAYWLLCKVSGKQQPDLITDSIRNDCNNLMTEYLVSWCADECEAESE